jgi:Bacterial regulatory proteins, tetR family.
VGAVDKPSRREAAAEETRREIVEAARRLFLRHGYVGTTVEAIAEEAGVAVQTIYNAYGSKGAVLSHLLDVTIVGDDEEASVLDRVRSRIDVDTIDPAALVRDLALMAARIVARISDVWEVVESAAAVDPEIAALVAKNDSERLRAYIFAAKLLTARRGLRRGLNVEGAAAIIWSVTGVRNHRFLVVGQGWSLERYRRWLEDALTAALLHQEN